MKHQTYHHFVGHGLHDSDLDVIPVSSGNYEIEELLQIHCKLEEPAVDSHHDLILSVSTVPQHHKDQVDKGDNLVAPKIENKRHKIVWSEEGAIAYQNLVSPHLQALREIWLQSTSASSMSILLQATNMVLSEAALLSNKSIRL